VQPARSGTGAPREHRHLALDGLHGLRCFHRTSLAPLVALYNQAGEVRLLGLPDRPLG
jgi:hypothetical protein